MESNLNLLKTGYICLEGEMTNIQRVECIIKSYRKSRNDDCKYDESRTRDIRINYKMETL